MTYSASDPMSPGWTAPRAYNYATALAAQAAAASPAVTSAQVAAAYTHWDGSHLTQNGSILSGIGTYPWQFRPEDYSAVGDVKVLTDGAITSGQAILTSASGPFTAADVGKAICVPKGTSANSDLSTTILSYQSATQVTLAANATATVTGGRVVWGTDDTTAIKNCVAAAVAYAQANKGYAEVIFSNTWYMLASAPSAGASAVCNAQIPLDAVPTTSRKVTLALKGTSNSSALYHWLQTTPQFNGPTLCTIWNPGTTSTSNNQRSVVGGPILSLQGAGNFSNMHVVVDGLTINTPENSQICGFDFKMIAEATVKSGACLARSNRTGAPNQPNLSLGGINDFAWGLRMPMTGNNALCDVQSFSAEGMVYGIIVEEHARIGSLRVVNNYNGLTFWASSGAAHANHVGYVCAESNVHHIACAGGYNQVEVEVLDIEMTGTGPGAMITDTGSTPATGTVNVYTNGTSTTVLSLLNNATYKPTSTLISVYDGAGAKGIRTAPGVPASTVAFTNAFWRDCAVTISGGTVSAIAVDGTTTGLTSGTVIVPSNKSITLTYTVAPTWVWVAL